MAASDNVLNVGFTDDKNSTNLVAKTITARPKTVPEIQLKHQAYHKGTRGNTTVYSVPFEEFSILQIKGTESLEPITGPGIAIVVDSKRTTIKDASGGETAEAPSGSVWFVGAGTKVEVGGEGELWMAFYDGDSKSADEVGEQ
jgi:mannose-6-phosphate isomerase